MINEKNYQHWILSTDKDDLMWLCLDMYESSANVLSAEVLEELFNILEYIQLHLPAGLIIYSGKRNGFIMGADIKGFTGMSDEDESYKLIRQGQKIVDNLESLKCPTVSVING
ncbi:MAG: enoyl-CoA hydratase-related protein, partial [Pseudomonadota bacterium]|nr:enoyl-CoA hydratase-related protein [Pseudomonadota bacterium]